MSGNLSDDCFIVMSKYGIDRLTKRKGSLKRGEISVKVHISVPESCFAEPDISVEIDVPESAVIKPKASVTVVQPDGEEG